MSDRPYTDTDVELAAEATYQHWHSGIPFGDQAADVRAEYLGGARAVLDALTAAGWTPAQQPAAPADSHVDGSDGPGWDRDTIEHELWWAEKRGRTSERFVAQVRALLADRDRLARDLERAVADIDRWAGELKRYVPRLIAHAHRYGVSPDYAWLAIPPADRSSDE